MNAMVWPFIHDGIPVLYYGTFLRTVGCITSILNRMQAKSRAFLAARHLQITSRQSQHSKVLAKHSADVA